MALSQGLQDMDSKTDTIEQMEFTDNIVVSDSLPEFVNVNIMEEGTIGIEVVNVGLFFMLHL